MSAQLPMSEKATCAISLLCYTARPVGIHLRGSSPLRVCLLTTLRMTRNCRLVGALLMVVLVACAPETGHQGVTARESPASGAEARPPVLKRLIVAASAEVNNLGPKLEGGNVYAVEYGFLLNSPLSVINPEGSAIPLLAAELPSRGAGTWTVDPDGTMRTTWRIRPNARWHDGRPVTSRDFMFALKVQKDEAMPQGGRVPERLMDRVEPVNDKTFIIHWSQPYPGANELGPEQLQPLPDHIIGAIYEAGNAEAFANDAFWSSPSYVGNGPFRIAQWERGAQLVYRANDEYFLGRPKIDEIVVRIISDPNTALANVLSGSVDMTLGITLGQGGAATVRGNWERSAEGAVFTTPVRLRFAQVQFDPAYNRQPALFDLRVRRAIVHGLDREATAKIVSEGTSSAADIPLPPTDPRYVAIDRAITKYPYDPNRALALFGDAGWTRRGESLANASGQPFELDIRALQSPDNETEQNLLASDLRKLGIEVTQSIVPQSRIREFQFRISFPGLNTTALGLDSPSNLNLATSDQCPNPVRAYSGINRGCWKNAEYDRLFAVASSTLEQSERAGALIQMLTILTLDVGILGLSYSSENISVRKGLVGPGSRWPQSATTWNVHEWHWR